MTWDFLQNSQPPFPLEPTKEDGVTLPLPDQYRLALRPLLHKNCRVLAEGEQKVAIVFWGPPNSGKTTGCSKYVEENYKKCLPSMVAVSYDEPILGDEKSGALFNLEKYATEYKKQKAIAASGGQPDRDALNEAYRKERANSQRVRSLTLNAAVEDGYDLCIDTTSASKGVFYMLNALEAKGYAIHVVGMISPLLVAEQRAAERLRLVEPDEVYSKRAGAYGTFQELIETRAKRAVLLYNPVNGKDPVVALKALDGAVVEKNEAVCAEIATNVLGEAAQCEKKERSKPYAAEIREKGESFLRVVRSPVVPVFGPKVGAMPNNNCGD